MKTSDAVRHFGSRVKIAAALSCTRSAVYQWGEIVPEGSAYKLQALAKGKVKVDPAAYVKAVKPLRGKK